MADGSQTAAPDDPGLQRIVDELVAGNERFAAGKPLHPRRDPARRAAIAGGHVPLVAILSCGDGRVPPEIVFDLGLGDAFVVRVPGAAADPSAMASLRFAVSRLGSRVVVVLTHYGCLAVQAALAPPSDDLRLLGPIGEELARELGDIAEPVRSDQPALFTEIAHRQLARIAADPVFAGPLREGRIRLIGAIYDAHSGQVRMVEHYGAGTG